MEDLAVPRRRFARRRVPDPEALIVATITEHAESLLRVARRHTRCQADAEDAYQRALEIFVKAAHRLDPATVHKWLHTVVKHEAYAVCEQRAKYVGVDDHESLDALDDGRHVASVEERSERFEELARAAEALKRLKPQEVTALVLKAQGLSYDEIAERQSWTYTKVNRCITEGRRSFLERYAGIQSGEECRRWMPVLSAMADGEATTAQVVDARPHLRNCPACRSVLGDLHRATAPIAALLPPALAGWRGRRTRHRDPRPPRRTRPRRAGADRDPARQGPVGRRGGEQHEDGRGGGVDGRDRRRRGRGRAPGVGRRRSRVRVGATDRAGLHGDDRAAAPAIATPPLRPATPASAPQDPEPARPKPRQERRQPAAPAPGAEFSPETVADVPAETSPSATPPQPTQPATPPTSGSDEFGFGG